MIPMVCGVCYVYLQVIYMPDCLRVLWKWQQLLMWRQPSLLTC